MPLAGAGTTGPFFTENPGLCIGVDEAGRGCLAGPVAAGAVLLPPDLDIPRLLPGLTDSKKLSPKQRAVLEQAIRRHALAWSLGLSWPQEIDRVNILNATFRAMSRAIATLRPPCPLSSCRLLIDGKHPIRPEQWRAVYSAPLPRQEAVIDGDSLLPAISAASILAKEFRDRLMAALDKRYPGYGFARHKGYGTKVHLDALSQKGACRLHRRTFRGVRPATEQLPLR